MHETLQNYLKQLKEIIYQDGYSIEESFLHLPFDPKIKEDVEKAINEVDLAKEAIKHIVVIGIGGSCWGAKAIYDALKTEKPLAQMHFLDQIEPDIIEQVVNQIKDCSANEVAILNISKSGTTTEVATNYSLLKKALPAEKKFTEFFIRGESFPKIEKEITVTMPDTVGGRFSGFTAVGILPLELAGVDTTTLLDGARKATEDILNQGQENLIQSVTEVFEAYTNGREVYNMFVFSKELLSLAEWQKQLIGESLGKDKKGLLPMISLGSRDLHSLQQYFVGGKPIVQHEIISVKGRNQYQDAIKDAVMEIYAEENIPHREIVLENLTETTLGEYMQTKFFETLLLAKLLEVNPFGQPDVEGYKRKIKTYK
jgi:glucose-6-phosphate isomerase